MPVSLCLERRSGGKRTRKESRTRRSSLGPRSMASLPPRRRRRGNVVSCVVSSCSSERMDLGYGHARSRLQFRCERCEVARLWIDLSSWVFPDRPFRQKKWIGGPAERPSLSPLCRSAVKAAFAPTPTSQLVLGITTGIQFSLGNISLML